VGNDRSKSVQLSRSIHKARLILSRALCVLRPPAKPSARFIPPLVRNPNAPDLDLLAADAVERCVHEGPLGVGPDDDDGLRLYCGRQPVWGLTAPGGHAPRICRFEAVAPEFQYSIARLQEPLAGNGSRYLAVDLNQRRRAREVYPDSQAPADPIRALTDEFNRRFHVGEHRQRLALRCRETGKPSRRFRGNHDHLPLKAQLILPGVGADLYAVRPPVSPESSRLAHFAVYLQFR